MLKLPAYERRHYRDTFLSRVIIQVGFPTILKIATDLPADFQDEIRRKYPEYEQNVEKSLRFEQDGSENISTNVAHHFSDDAEDWVVHLAPSQLSLICNHYTRWEEARDRFTELVSAVWRVYEPDKVNGLVLLYQDIFEEIGAETSLVWRNFFRNELVSGFANETLHTAFKGGRQQLVLEDDGSEIVVDARARTGRTEDEEPAQRLDLDFKMSQRGLDFTRKESLAALENFHDTLIGLFEWAITDELRADMNPTEAPDE